MGDHLMSHNNVKIGTAEPNSSGEFTVALNNLSDVSGTPSDGELLQYSSGAWAPASVSGSATIQYLKWGNGEAEPYDDSPATSMAAGQTLYLYDENGYNGISGATVSSTTSTGTGGGEWLNSVTLPAGTYRIVLNVDAAFSGTGYMTFAVFDGASRVTSQGSIGTATSTLGAGGPTSEAILVLTASTTLNAEITAVSSVDSVVNQGNTIAEHGFLLIEKMG
jgi:hypothetical protein